MNRTNLIAAVVALLFSINISAQAEPTPEEQDPSAPNRTEVVCGGTASFISLKFGATRDSNGGNVFKLKPVGGAPDKRAVTSGTITLERGHEFSFTLTWIPRGSNLVRGEDLMNATVRYQRRESADKVKVLAEEMITSDQLTNFGELQARRTDLLVSTRFNNPEVATVLANSRRPSAQDALKAGQLPDGITTNGTFECSMKVGKSADLN